MSNSELSIEKIQKLFKFLKEFNKLKINPQFTVIHLKKYYGLMKFQKKKNVIQSF